VKYVIGSDEVGTGAWAGPIYVCAVAAPVGWRCEGLNDSKKLTEVKRSEVYMRVRPQVICALVFGSVAAIDHYGMGPVLFALHAAAVKTLYAQFPGSDVIIDGEVASYNKEAVQELPPGTRCVPKADGTYPAVMAASVLAKVNRDAEMREHSKLYPAYGFASNKGYGSAAHTAALAQYGVTPIHRKSYRPIREALEKNAT
jgi:ribonuclease HII